MVVGRRRPSPHRGDLGSVIMEFRIVNHLRRQGSRYLPRPKQGYSSEFEVGQSWAPSEGPPVQDTQGSLHPGRPRLGYSSGLERRALYDGPPAQQPELVHVSSESERWGPSGGPPAQGTQGSRHPPQPLDRRCFGRSERRSPSDDDSPALLPNFNQNPGSKTSPDPQIQSAALSHEKWKSGSKLQHPTAYYPLTFSHSQSTPKTSEPTLPDHQPPGVPVEEVMPPIMNGDASRGLWPSFDANQGQPFATAHAEAEPVRDRPVPTNAQGTDICRYQAGSQPDSTQFRWKGDSGGRWTPPPPPTLNIADCTDIIPQCPIGKHHNGYILYRQCCSKLASFGGWTNLSTKTGDTWGLLEEDEKQKWCHKAFELRREKGLCRY
ncbi:hypothetical protein PM082_000067 [Marasmius tenuissimus]|nr:hypothetical protein PM082_000067 [Marasmius tenuissimus]